MCLVGFDDDAGLRDQQLRVPRIDRGGPGDIRVTRRQAERRRQLEVVGRAAPELANPAAVTKNLMRQDRRFGCERHVEEEELGGSGEAEPERMGGLGVTFELRNPVVLRPERQPKSVVEILRPRLGSQLRVEAELEGHGVIDAPLLDR